MLSFVATIYTSGASPRCYPEVAYPVDNLPASYPELGTGFPLDLIPCSLEIARCAFAFAFAFTFCMTSYSFCVTSYSFCMSSYSFCMFQLSSRSTHPMRLGWISTDTRMEFPFFSNIFSTNSPRGSHHFVLLCYVLFC